MPGLDNYDQWKTASPYDGQPDGDLLLDELDQLLAQSDAAILALPQADARLLAYLRELRDLLNNETGL